MNPLQTHSKNILLTKCTTDHIKQTSRLTDFLGRHTNSLVITFQAMWCMVMYVCLFHTILALNTALSASSLSQRHRVLYWR